MKRIQIDIEKVRMNHLDIEHRNQSRFETSLSQAAEQIKNPSGTPNRRKALLQERLWVFKDLILPALSRAFALYLQTLPLHDAERVMHALQSLGEGNERRLGQLMDAMPAMGHWCEVMSIRVTETGRKYKGEDFADNEHAQVAPVYSDAPIHPANYTAASVNIFEAAGPSVGLGLGLVTELPAELPAVARVADVSVSGVAAGGRQPRAQVPPLGGDCTSAGGLTC